jgi:hypothetical protein
LFDASWRQLLKSEARMSIGLHNVILRYYTSFMAEVLYFNLPLSNHFL